MKTDGRYLGGDAELSIVLRVDVAGSAVISGELSRYGELLASMRTAPGVPVTGAAGQWPAVWQDRHGATSTGTLTVAAMPDRPDRLAVTIRLDAAIAGLRPSVEHAATVEWQGPELRDLALEIETEQGVQPAGPVDFQEAATGLAECLRAAGFTLGEAGDRTRITAQSQPWDYSMIFTILNDLMAATATANLSRPEWIVHLLQLSRCSRESLTGVMFDHAEPLPRQGAAVFVNRIRQLAAAGHADREVLRTTVHELGHALNLVHRFERSVGRADSTSFMNYPSRYRLGGQERQYWADFGYSFDPDELEFLRHGPPEAVRPGEAAFHSVRYWVTGPGGYVPYLPELPEPGLRLELEPPATGPVFAFGQPVLLGVSLHNQTGTRFEFGADPLDPKTGGVEVLIRRVTGGRGDPAAGEVFVPMMRACLAEDESTRVSLPPGGVLRNNLNLTYGSGGFAFAEPGSYELVPLLGLPYQLPGAGWVERLVRGPALRVRVGYPHTPAAERDALVLLRPDVGAWFALGGSDCLARAADDLAELSDRRRAVDPADPVAAGIVRAAGINAGREFLRLRDGRVEHRSGDPHRAAELLASLDPPALRNFDPQTAAGTAALARHYASQARG